jgi:hypothetical protein
LYKPQCHTRNGEIMPTQTVDMKSLLKEMRLLGRFGDNATFRRAYSLVTSYAEGKAPDAPVITCHDPRDPRDPREPHEPHPHRPFSFDRVLHETQEDMMRRSVFLDPEEAFVANLVDFFGGRVRVLEFRNPNKINMAALEAKARDYLVGRVPAVTVNLAAAKSMEEVIFTLRHMADSLQNRVTQDAAEEHIALYNGDTVTVQAASCIYQRKEQYGSRYVDNGHTLEYHYRDVYRCMPEDACCTNQAYTEYRNDKWETVWKDGNSTTPPPTPADQMPDFVSSAWQNRLPLLTDPTVGTLTSDHGWRRLIQPDGTYRPDFHPGVDVAVAAGSNVQSNVAGTVVAINPGNGTNPDRGIFVRDANNIVHMYWHINPANTLQVNDPIAAGDRLGSTYDWGTRTHLHYAEYAPPGGDYTRRSDENSRNPLP